MEATQRFETFTTEDVCGYRHQLLSQQETFFKKLISEYEAGLKELRRLAKEEKNGPLKNNRIVHTHAVIYGGARLLQHVFPNFDDALWNKFVNRLVKLAIDRQMSVREDTVLVQLFLETVEWFKEQGTTHNHSKNEHFIAVNLNEFINACHKSQLPYFDDIQQLRRELKNSNFYKFLEANKPTHSALVFEKSLNVGVLRI